MHVFPGEERFFFFALGDRWVPALTCRHLAKQGAVSEQQPNNWFRGADANKEKKRKVGGGAGGRRRGKAPTTPVKTHLGAFKNSSQDPSHRGSANYCVSSRQRGKRI